IARIFMYCKMCCKTSTVRSTSSLLGVSTSCISPSTALTSPRSESNSDGYFPEPAGTNEGIGPSSSSSSSSYSSSSNSSPSSNTSSSSSAKSSSSNLPASSSSSYSSSSGPSLASAIC